MWNWINEKIFSSVKERHLTLNMIIKEDQIKQFRVYYIKLKRKKYVGDNSKAKSFNSGLNKVVLIIVLIQIDNLEEGHKHLISIYPIVIPPNKLINNKIVMRTLLEYTRSNIELPYPC